MARYGYRNTHCPTVRENTKNNAIEAYRLRYYEELTFAEIGRRLSVTPNWARSLAYKGRHIEGRKWQAFHTKQRGVIQGITLIDIEDSIK